MEKCEKCEEKKKKKKRNKKKKEEEKEEKEKKKKNICLGAQKNRLIEYPQHMFWLRNKKKKFPAKFL